MSRNPILLKWIEKLQTHGRYTFTRTQVESETGRSFVAAQSALRRLKEQGRIVSPKRGFYVVVPPEYRTVGSPPASWFIDDLMRYLGQPYYVGLLSAAAIYGAAHQQPMVFQVVTSKPTREMRSGKVTIQFTMNKKIEQIPIVEKQTETGTMRVATPEVTAFDLICYPVAAGHMSNAVMVLSELVEKLDGQALAKTASLIQVPNVQRLGYLLDMIDESEVANHLTVWLKKQKTRPTPLIPEEPANVKADNRWNVLPNAELELDL